MPKVVNPYEHVTLRNQLVENTLAGIVGEDLPTWVRTIRGVNGSARRGEISRRDLTYDRPTNLRGQYIWGGFVPTHPGHFVGEQAPRLLISAREQPDAKALFVIQTSNRANVTQDPAEVPSWFWEVTTWLGLPPERIAFLAGPALVEELTVYPQAEYLPNGGPSSAYLDALDANWADKGLAPIESEALFVSRGGMPVRYSGERYLEQLLSENGVTVIRPETLSLETQMRHCAGAKTIIISGGSAIHFRCLLGRFPQHLAVINRRHNLSGQSVHRALFESRVATIDFLDLSRGYLIGPYTELRKNRVAKADPKVTYYAESKPPAFTSKEKTIAFFQRLGIDLAPQWDDRKLAVAEREFIREYHKYCLDRYKHLDPLRITQNIRVSLQANMNGVTPGAAITDELVPLEELVYLGDTRVTANSPGR